MASHVSKSWYDLLRPTWRLVKLDQRELVILLVYIIALGIVSAAVPFASQIVVNQTAFTGQAQPILILAVIVLAVAIMGAFVKLFQLRVTELLYKRVFARSALDGTRTLLMNSSGKNALGDREIANRFFDVMMFQSKFSMLASEGLGVVVLTLLGVIILAFYHPFLMAFSLTVIFAVVLVIVPFAKRGIDRAYAKSVDKYDVAYWLSQVAENRGLLRQAYEPKLLYGPTDRGVSAYIKSHFSYLNLLLFQGGSLFFLQAIAGAAFLGLGGLLVVRGSLNLGQLVAAEIILLSVLGTIGKFNYYLDSFYEMVVSGKKVTDLVGMDLPPAILSDSEQANFNSVGIASPWLESDVNLRSGDVIIVKGTTRSRRSEFLQAFATLDSNVLEVRFDAEQFVPQACVSRSLLYLAQPVVFRMSLAENLGILSADPESDSAANVVYQLPLLTAKEKESAKEEIRDYEIGLIDRARYSVLRAFQNDRRIVIVDFFFDLLESADQVSFVKEFKKRFPTRVLVLNTTSSEVERIASQVIRLREEAQ